MRGRGAARYDVHMSTRGVVLTAVLLGLCVCTAAAEEIVETYPDGSPKLRYEVDADGARHGAHYEYDEQGVMRRSASFRKGQLHGVERHFRADGSLEQSAAYAAGELHGSFKRHDETGRLRTHARYRKGQLHGPLQSWHANGKPARRARYRNGKLHGKQTTFDEQGAVLVKSEHAEGALHGRYEVFRGKERLTQQHWSRGKVVDVDGVVPFPRTKEEVSGGLRRLLGTATGIPKDEVEADRARALRVLQAYRFLVGVPFEEMSLLPRYNELAQAGAELCDAVGELSHTPPNPGWSAERYAEGAAGAISCNLGWGTAEASVHGYMDDSDPSNINDLGHRSWCVYPALKETGFGRSKRMTAMHCMDRSGKVPGGLDVVRYPPAGYVPRRWFGPKRVWTVFLASPQFREPTQATLKVRVEPVGEDFLPSGAPLELDHLRAASAQYGIRKRVAFRPVGLETRTGSRYRISIEGLVRKGKPAPEVFFVEFYESPTPPRVPRTR